MAAGPASNHNGGRILFGPDGKLYVVIGDNAQPSNAQDRTANLRGKILRLNPDGSIPATNPFGTRIWAYGIRNSIGFAFDPQGGHLWESENGPECNDEVNRIVRGGNHGWGPNESCPNTNNSGPTPRILPKYTFANTVGLTGLAFCDACGLGPAFNGDLVVGAVNDGRIRRFDLNASRTGFDAGPLLVLDRPGPGALRSRSPRTDGSTSATSTRSTGWPSPSEEAPRARTAPRGTLHGERQMGAGSGGVHREREVRYGYRPSEARDRDRAGLAAGARARAHPGALGRPAARTRTGARAGPGPRAGADPRAGPRHVLRTTRDGA